MTKDECLKHLKKMTMFGNINDIELDGYVKTLCVFNEKHLAKAVELIIGNYQYRRFPLPADIIGYIKGVAKDCAENKHYGYLDPDPKPKATKIFWKCFRSILAFNSRYYEKWQTVVCQDAPDPDIATEENLLGYFSTALAGIEQDLKNPETHRRIKHNV